MNEILFWIFSAVAIKSILIGSDFSFYYLFLDKTKYLKWYDNRPEYKTEREVLEKTNERI